MILQTILFVGFALIPTLFTSLRVVEMIPIGMGLSILLSIHEVKLQIYGATQTLAAEIMTRRDGRP